MVSRYTTLGLLLLMILGCRTMNSPSLNTVDYVDLNRFMGDWYVLAAIPTFLEKEAYNAVESYRLNDDGTIATTFTFRKGGFSGPEKRYNPTGYVLDTQSNAVWGMQFVWPIKADFRIIYLSEDYGITIIGRNKRDYVWLMGRSPVIADADYQALKRFIADQGYDINQLRQVPQQWDAQLNTEKS